MWLTFFFSQAHASTGWAQGPSHAQASSSLSHMSRMVWSPCSDAQSDSLCPGWLFTSLYTWGDPASVLMPRSPIVEQSLTSGGCCVLSVALLWVTYGKAMCFLLKFCESVLDWGIQTGYEVPVYIFLTVYFHFINFLKGSTPMTACPLTAEVPTLFSGGQATFSLYLWNIHFHGSGGWTQRFKLSLAGSVPFLMPGLGCMHEPIF